MMRCVVLAALCLLLLAGCGRAPQTTRPASITVFAAASLTDAFTRLAEKFESNNPGLDVVLNFAGSNQLATQIAQGAPADVFAAANEAQMIAAVGTGRVDPEAAATFATNRLVIIYPAANPAHIKRPQDLAAEGLLLVLAAPEVPAGRYALDFLDKAVDDPAYGSGFREAVLGNLVSQEQNVRAVLTKVALGEADAGIVYASDLAGELGERVDRLEIPDALNTVAIYPIATLNDSAHPDAARSFVDLVLSAEGEEILANHGFAVVTAP